MFATRCNRKGGFGWHLQLLHGFTSPHVYLVAYFQTVDLEDRRNCFWIHQHSAGRSANLRLAVQDLVRGLAAPLRAADGAEFAGEIGRLAGIVRCARCHACKRALAQSD